MKKYLILLILGIVMLVSVPILADPFVPPPNPFETKSIIIFPPYELSITP